MSANPPQAFFQEKAKLADWIARNPTVAVSGHGIVAPNADFSGLSLTGAELSAAQLELSPVRGPISSATALRLAHPGSRPLNPGARTTPQRGRRYHAHGMDVTSPGRHPLSPRSVNRKPRGRSAEGFWSSDGEPVWNAVWNALETAYAHCGAQPSSINWSPRRDAVPVLSPAEGVT